MKECRVQYTPMPKRTPVAGSKGKTMKKAPQARVKALPARTAKPLSKTKTKITAVKAPRRSLHLGMHLAIAGSAIAVLFFLGVVERNIYATRGSNAESVPSTIGLEHDSPLSLSVLVAKKPGAGYVSMTNESNETIHISVPSSWTRTEVTGAPLADVSSDIPVFGFTRWKLPGKTGIKMLLPETPDAIFFDSVSEATTAVDLKTIDLETSQVSNRVVLVQKQSLVELWGNDE